MNNHTSFEVDKETFEKMRSMFGIYDCDSGFGTVATSTKGVIPDGPAKEFQMKFRVHQGPFYWVNKNSLRYFVYCDSR